MMKRTRPPALAAKASDGVCEVNLVDSDKVADAKASLPSERDLRMAADALRVLANPNRLCVLTALQGRELCVCDLREVLNISMSGTSQVLRELRKLGAYYKLADTYWLELAEGIYDKLAITGAR